MAKCPSPDCRLECGPGYLACTTHWFALPRPLRDRLWSLGRTRFRTTRTAVEYRAAVREAVAYLKERA